jgi:quinol-cytochrome oxidoreductase complex cytochrome b subunit
VISQSLSFPPWHYLFLFAVRDYVFPSSLLALSPYCRQLLLLFLLFLSQVILFYIEYVGIISFYSISQRIIFLLPGPLKKKHTHIQINAK